MARRKSVCSKWTLIICVVLVCPFVNSRPQETSSQAPSISTTTSSVTSQPTENALRYRHRPTSSKIALSRSNLPKVSFVLNAEHMNDRSFRNSLINTNVTNNIILKQSENPNANVSSRSRLIRKVSVNRNNIRNIKTHNMGHESGYTKSADHKNVPRKPAIRRVITKWTDKAKYEDLPFYQDISSSTEQDLITFSNSLNVDEYSSTGTIIDRKPLKKPPPHRYNTIKPQNNYNSNIKPKPNINEKHHGHTNKVHLINYPFPSVKPSYIFTTPTPTPIITNVGNPKPWYPNQLIHHQPTTRKPLKNINNYHNYIHNQAPYYGDNFEVTTFQPMSAYTEQIVIRPEEYSAMDECPTIYLTLNNTFQGQGKEACPDLNIAVNTNVVNKNIAVESEEDDETDDFFPGAFGALGDSDESIAGDTSNEYADSDEAPDVFESASVESAEFSNLNAFQAPPAVAPPAIAPGAPAPPPGAPGGAGGGGSPSSALTTGKPGHGNKDDDEDTFSISGLMSYFQPAVNAMTWLSAVNPLSFTMMSLVLTPLAMFVAAYSGVTAIFAPLGLAREAPKVVHVYKPKWEWDDKYKTWFLNSHPNDRRWRPIRRFPREKNQLENYSHSIVKETWFHRLKDWMISMTRKLKERTDKLSKQNIRKNKRKKRETWTRRIK